MKTSLFIGRWQVPELHEGHKALIQTAIDDGNHVVVGIRDTDLDESNPYPVYVRHQAIRKAFGHSVGVVVIPDRDCDLEVCIGRNVGYDVRQIDLPPELEAISGTAIRDGKVCLWLTGNSGAGKTTLARALSRYIDAVILDGDEMRASVSLGAGFSIAERLEHNLRVARLAKILLRQTNVIVAVIAPVPSIREAIEEILSPVWVYVKRTLPFDPNKPYTPPTNPHITVGPDNETSEESAQKVLRMLRRLECPE